MLLLSLLAQVTPVQPIVKGTALPPPASAEAEVLAPVQALFGALAAGDGAALLRTVRPEGGGTVVVERTDGGRIVRHTGWAEFAGRLTPGGPREVEAISDPAIEIDGDIAMVWAPYTVSVGGSVQHCGTDHFDLVREGGVWKVLNVTWTQRTTGCAG